MSAAIRRTPAAGVISIEARSIGRNTAHAWVFTTPPIPADSPIEEDAPYSETGTHSADAARLCSRPMPYSVIEFQETPNPNAVKCILDRPIRARELGPASFRAGSAAAEDPIAARLFAVPGVTNLLINEDWVTVNKSPDVDWKSVKSEVERVLSTLG